MQDAQRSGREGSATPRGSDFFIGGGEMGARIRAHDWAATPLGPVERWPQSLRTAISVMLNSKFPTYMAWGPELTSFYNDAYRPLLGSKPEALGRPFHEVWAEVWNRIGPIAQRALAGEASYFEDMSLVLERNGYPEQTWWTFSCSPISDESGGVGGILCFVHETTARVLAERSARHLAAIVESSEDAIISKDVNGIITTWNKGAERIFGYTAAEAIGKSILILIPPDRHHEETEILARIGRGDRVDHYETVRRRKDGSLVDISLTSSPVKDGQGRIIGISKIARDITERRQAEERLKLLAREVDHRGKNTLALVQAIVRMTRADTVTAFVKIATGRIGALARVHTLLAASSWRGADLRQLVEEELAPYGANDAARIRVAGPGLALQASAAQALAMALHELATNAVKYGALSVPHGAVSVQWTFDVGGGFALYWSETGGPAVSAPQRSGTGTGVIERAVCNQLGGEVDFDWRAEGLVCRITVPATQLARGRSVA